MRLRNNHFAFATCILLAGACSKPVDLNEDLDAGVEVSSGKVLYGDTLVKAVIENN